MLTLIISLSVIAYLIIAFIVLTIVMYFELSEPSYNKLEKSIVVGMGLLWPISILVFIWALCVVSFGEVFEYSEKLAKSLFNKNKGIKK